MSIIIFIIVLFSLVLVHEFGHFIVAKLTGMRVNEFGIGFPPKLFGLRKGETEYTLNLFPIGGFVKIEGEDGSGTSEATSPADSFVSKSRWAQAAVLVAGVTMNILFAWFLFTVAFTAGVRTAVDEASATTHADLVITDIVPRSPAANSSLPVAAVIKHVSAGSDVLTALTPSAFSAFMATHKGEEVTLAYERGSERVEKKVVPQVGLIHDDPNRAAIGVALSLVDTVSRPFPVALRDACTHTWTSLLDITAGIAGLVKQAVLFRADLSQVAGPVGIVGLVGDASAFGFVSLLMFTAFISLNLAIINLLPFPALDGGRLLFVAIEALRRKPLNPRIAATVNTVGFAMLILLMVLVTWHDIARLLG